MATHQHYDYNNMCVNEHTAAHVIVMSPNCHHSSYWKHMWCTQITPVGHQASIAICQWPPVFADFFGRLGMARSM
eukprot:103576-Alexandrium_andersonii.AAC.1